MTKKITVSFKLLGLLSQPYDWDKEADAPGIYLWIENREGRNIINYIGKSHSSVLRRNRFHFENTVSGQYPVPMAYFSALDDKEKYYAPKGERKNFIYSNEEALKTFISYAFKYRDQITVYYSSHPIDDLKDLEANLIHILKPEENIYKHQIVDGLEVEVDINDLIK